MSDKYILVIKKDFKSRMVSKRKDFMDLLIKTLGDNEEARQELFDKFGTKMVEKYDNGNTVTILNDGEVIYKD